MRLPKKLKPPTLGHIVKIALCYKVIIKKCRLRNAFTSAARSGSFAGLELIFSHDWPVGKRAASLNQAASQTSSLRRMIRRVGSRIDAEVYLA